MRIYDTITEKVFSISGDKLDRVLYGFRKKCIALDRLRDQDQDKDLQLYFLTLTLNRLNEHRLNGDLHKFLDFASRRFKRVNAYFKYVWVLEFQKKRYLKTGVLVPHWHIAILTLRGGLPDVQFNANRFPHYKVLKEGSIIHQSELFKFWGYGQVFCERAFSSNLYGYLSKYFEKESLSSAATARASRKGSLRQFGSSNFDYYSYPKWAFDSVVNGSQIYSDMLVSKKGSILDIIGLDSQGCLIERVRIRSPYVVLHYPY
jgi:hypothetical protein